MISTRDYEGLVRTIEKTVDRDEDVHRRMQLFVDAAWEALRERGVSWIGFYLHSASAGEDTPLVLGPRRDKPACSPIGLHGVCGQAYTGGATRIVHDVMDLGDNYVACDPRDRSEIVIPLFTSADRDRCWGVLDVDSFDVGAFDESDERGLKDALHAAGFIC